MDTGAGIPTTQDFWDMLFAQAADYGVAVWIHVRCPMCVCVNNKLRCRTGWRACGR